MAEPDLLVQLARPDGTWLDVGRLHYDSPKTTFESFSAYWAADNRPLIGQVFEQESQHWRPAATIRLPKWFAHLLPEGRLRDAIAADIGVHRDRDFELLRRIGGDDLPGAIRTRETTSHGRIKDSTKLDGTAAETSNEQLLKFSLAGVQLKFSVTETDRGLTLPVSGQAGRFIAKLPDQRHAGVPEAEHAAMTLAAAAGIDVAPTRLISAQDIARLPPWAAEAGPSLLVDRFDRRGDGRVHVEEFAQILQVGTSEGEKYRHANFETIANVAARLAGIEAVRAVVERIVFNTLVGNGDAHLKNWAFMYPDGRSAELSPAYDLVPTVLYTANDDLGLKLNNSKRFEDVTPDSFRRLGERSGFGAVNAVEAARVAVTRVIDAWPVLEALLPATQFRELTSRRDSLPLTRAT